MKKTPTPKPGRPPKYDFGSLRVGQALVIPPGKGRAVCSCANTWAKRNNPKARFAVRGPQCIRLPDKP